MSAVIFMEKLLDGVEVEWKPLGTVINTITAPSKLKSQAYRATGSLPIIDQGIEFIAGYTDEDITPVEAGEYVIFGDHSEHIKYVDFSFVQGADGIKILSSVSANAKYIYYAFLNFYTKELSYKRHWSTAQQTLIPIPCPENPKKSHEIQAEIVRILDAFTAHTAELTAELTARKKQYNYYRDKLLSFEDGEVEWKTLGEVVRIKHGKDWKHLSPGDVPVYGSGGVMTYVNEYVYDKPTVLIPRKGSITNIFYIDEPFWNVDTIFYTEINESIIQPKYLYYFMKTIDMMSLDSGSGRPSLTQAILNNIDIPLPSIDKQIQIIATLDRFDKLTLSIYEGLPREIELRQKQYEYYRDLLLSFPKPEAAAVSA